MLPTPGRGTLQPPPTTNKRRDQAMEPLLLANTSRNALESGVPKGFGPIAAGFGLTLVHMISIPVSNTSVNPARSIATAVFQGDWALGQVWAFIVFPLIGAVLGVLVWLLVHDERLEDTMFGGQQGLINARNRAAAAANRVEGSINQRLP